VLDPNEDKRWRVLVGAVESDTDSKLFQCCHESCNRVFTSKGSLKLHLQRKHDTPGLFTCPVETCARQFSYKHVLQTHIERVHHMPFDYTAFPNPKRQRTPRKVSALAQAANQLLEGSQNDSVEAGNYQDSDLDSEDDEPAAKLIKSATKAAKAAENEGSFSLVSFPDITPIMRNGQLFFLDMFSTWLYSDQKCHFVLLYSWRFLLFWWTQYSRQRCHCSGQPC